MSISDTARSFFDACEAGDGWEACASYCTDNASFSCQADALAEITTLADYAEWMKGLGQAVPDMRPEIKFWGVDQTGNSVSVFAVFHGTQTGEGGPVPPTGNTVAADYVYVMNFEGDKISHVTKIWNDGHSLKQLGWA